ncbi:MAG: hypothetical protein KKA07_14475 [Bacteroidetes bacterium]|nr:hypothetical protein [Bacteroidota bacterium]MBU1720266.1 hypothetical protein [Bacteroidota bacterium]
MYKTFMNTLENPNFVIEHDVLSSFRKQKEKPTQIQHGMTTNEIADFVSDTLISFIRKQFEEAKIDSTKKD